MQVNSVKLKSFQVSSANTRMSYFKLSHISQAWVDDDIKIMDLRRQSNVYSHAGSKHRAMVSTSPAVEAPNKITCVICELSFNLLAIHRVVNLLHSCRKCSLQCAGPWGHSSAHSSQTVHDKENCFGVTCNRYTHRWHSNGTMVNDMACGNAICMFTNSKTL